MADVAVRFAFIKLVVGDLERMADFYGRVLGLVVTNRIQGEGLTEFVMRPSPDDQGFCLVLMRYADDRDRSLGGAYGALAVYVPDVDAAHARALADGAAPLREPFDVRGLRVAFVTDPEGREIEFLAPIRRAG